MGRLKHSKVIGYLFSFIGILLMAYLASATMSDLASATEVGSNGSGGLGSELKSPNTVGVKSPNTALGNQEYALCAGAESFNFNGVTYAKCRKQYGNSLGITHSYSGGNVQTVNDIGTAPGNGSFIVSTYSPPDSSLFAIYDCKGKRKAAKTTGSFAQCDGGICFTNTSGRNFPGVGPVADDEIICSCPIISTSIYHVWGPADCPATQSEYDAICAKGSKKMTRADGAILHVGNTGPPIVTLALDAMYDKRFGTKSTPKICERPCGRGGDADRPRPPNRSPARQRALAPAQRR